MKGFTGWPKFFAGGHRKGRPALPHFTPAACARLATASRKPPGVVKHVQNHQARIGELCGAMRGMEFFSAGLR